MSRLAILAVEPWLGGSHAAFLEAWRRHSAHRVDVLGLPARHWRWRMEGGAFELAQRVKAEGLAPPDVVLASDYLDLPRFAGFLPPAWAGVPTALYFHENQLTYPTPPDQEPAERDLTYAFANVLSCLAADWVVFNSRYHRDAFGAAARELVARLPKPRPAEALERKLATARVIGPGVELEALPLGPGPPAGAPLRLVFNHRWEHDKDPAAFLAAALEAMRGGARLELALLGEAFGDLPHGVPALLEALGDAVRVRGYAADRAEYARRLGQADLVVSTARHEFFGVALLEGVAAGCAPLAPRRLAYPEVLGEELAEGLYGEGELPARLAAAAGEPERWRTREGRARRRSAVDRHDARRTAAELDALCEALART